jgi:RHS repeat-associated protein
MVLISLHGWIYNCSLKEKTLCMKMKNSLNCMLILILTVCFTGKLFAQTQIEPDPVQNPSASPNTMSMGDYAKLHGVNHYTGMAVTNIPLYTVKSGTAEVPISLLYNASGVRVASVPGSVGTGWSLYAGGVITRELNGYPDDNNHPDGKGYDYGGMTVAGSSSPSELLHKMNNNLDAEPDGYNFTFGGRTGKFFIANADKAGTLPYQDLDIKIERTHSGTSDYITGIVIKDESGNEFAFRKVEVTNSVTRTTLYDINRRNGVDTPIVVPWGQKNLDYHSAWHLTKITTAQGLEIVFDYNTYTHTIVSTSESTVKCADNDCSYTSATGLNADNFKKVAVTTCSTTTHLIKSITTNFEEIIFDNSVVKPDGSGVTGLAKISVYKKTIPSLFNITSNDFLAKRYQFVYLPIGQRLFLTELKEVDKNGNSINPYKFTYTNPTDLPAFTSMAVDFWGYYNGQTSNGTYIPKIYIYPTKTHSTGRYSVFSIPEPGVITQPGANRTPHEVSAKAGVLNKVTYPDGGYSTYEYELHRFKSANFGTIAGGGLRLKSSSTYDGFNPDKVLNKTYDYTLDGTNTSGKIVALPLFAYDMGNYISSCSSVNANMYDRFSHPVNGPSVYNIGYTKVTERIGDNGKSEYEFSMPGTDGEVASEDGMYSLYGVDLMKAPDYENLNYNLVCGAPAHGHNVYPYSVVTEYNWLRGLLLSRKDYSKDNNITPYYEIYNTYKTFFADNSSDSWLWTLRSAMLYNPGTTTPMNIFAYSQGDIFLDRAKVLSSSVEKIYDLKPGSNNVLINTTEYTYQDNTSLSLPIITKTTNSDGIEYYQKTTYNNSSSCNTILVTSNNNAEARALKKMYDDHIVNIPIESIRTIKKPSQPEEIIAGSVNTFQILPNNKIVPAKAYALELAASTNASNIVPCRIQTSANVGDFIFSTMYKLQESLNEYDSYCNSTELLPANGIPTTTIYNSKGSLPVAKINNAQRKECSYVGFERGTINTSSPDEEDDYWTLPVCAQINSTDAHIGKYSVKATTGCNAMKKRFYPNNQYGKFILSCWVKTETGFITNQGSISIHPVVRGSGGSGTVYGATAQTQFSHTNNQWKYVQVIIDLSVARTTSPTDLDLVANISNFGSKYFLIDDVQFRPYNSSMQYMNYHSVFALPITETDHENTSVYIEYDPFGRVLKGLDNDKNLITYTEYYQKNPAVSTDRSYEITYKTIAAGVPHTTLNDVKNNSNVRQNVVYKDGLGRPIQSIAVSASPDMNDIITPVEYDHLGRQTKNYLPFVTTDNATPGSYRSDVLGNQGMLKTFYKMGQRIPRCSNPWYENSFESSMMNRLIERSAPGFEWRKAPILGEGHTKLYYYRTNTCYDDILFWQYNYSTNLWESIQTYPAGTLNIEEIRDENYHWIIIVKDKLGKEICRYTQKKEFGGYSTKDLPMKFDYNYYTVTYNLYNELGQLAAFISPEGMQKMAEANVFVLTQDITQKWVTTCAYDAKGRMISKNAGKENEELFVYDKRNHIVLKRTNSLEPGLWDFYKYDELGRSIMNGIYNSGNTNNSVAHISLQTLADASSIIFERLSNADFSHQQGYTNNAFPVITDYTKILSVNYYDNYDFDNNGNADVVIPPGVMSEVFGRVTAIKQHMLLPDGSIDQAWLQTENFFDTKGRVVEVHADNHLSGEEIVTKQYNFTNDLTVDESQRTANGHTVTILKEYEYDHMLRLTNTYHSINGGTRILLSNIRYNELGNMYEKNLHSEDDGVTFLQSVDYSFDAQGHLTHINNFDLSNDLLLDRFEYLPLEISSAANIKSFALNEGAVDKGTATLYINEAVGKVQDHIRSVLYNNGGAFDITYNPAKTAEMVTDKWIGTLQGFYGGNQEVMELALLSQLPCGITYYSNRQNAPVDYDPRFYATNILRNDIIKKLKEKFPFIIPTTDRTKFNQEVKAVFTAIKQTYNISFNIPDQAYLLPDVNTQYMQCGTTYFTNEYRTALSTFILAGFHGFTETELIPVGTYNQIVQARILQYGSCNITIPANLYLRPDIKPINEVAIATISKEMAISLTRMIEQKGYSEDDFATVQFMGDNLSEAMLDPEYNERPYTTQFTYEVKYTLEYDLKTLVQNTVGITEPVFRNAIQNSLAAYIGAVTPSFGIAEPLIYNDDDDDLWGLQLNYASLYNSPSEYAQYNGNVSQALWKMIGEPVNIYTYSYDALDRITKAEFYRFENSNSKLLENAFNVNLIKYDNNGNILRINRNGMLGWDPNAVANVYGQMDDLNYYYKGNKLLAVEDAVNNSVVAPYALHFADDAIAGSYSESNTATHDYLYSVNGSMVTDRNRGIDEIKYNLLNLPATITFVNGDKIEITYLADGTKLTQLITQSSGTNQTDYVHDVIYENNNLSYLFHDDGRAINNNGDFEYHYTIKDQIGSERLTFGKGINGLARVIQHDAFYPFGMRLGGINYVAGMESPYLFNGKEWITQGGLNMYDYGWRMYDPTIGRWHCPDPAQQDFSPYVFCGNNPIIRVDKDGKFWHIVIGAVVGGVFNTIVNWDSENTWQENFRNFGIGAAAGALGAATGGMVNAAIGGASVIGSLTATTAAPAAGGFFGGMLSGSVGGYVSGMASGFGNGYWVKGYRGADLLHYAAQSTVLGALGGGIFGGVTAGLSAMSNGGSFWKGMPTDWGRPGQYDINNGLLGGKNPLKQMEVLKRQLANQNAKNSLTTNIKQLASDEIVVYDLPMQKQMPYTFKVVPSSTGAATSTLQFQTTVTPMAPVSTWFQGLSPNDVNAIQRSIIIKANAEQMRATLNYLLQLR